MWLVTTLCLQTFLRRLVQTYKATSCSSICFRQHHKFLVTSELAIVPFHLQLGVDRNHQYYSSVQLRLRLFQANRGGSIILNAPHIER